MNVKNILSAMALILGFATAVPAVVQARPHGGGPGTPVMQMDRKPLNLFEKNRYNINSERDCNVLMDLCNYSRMGWDPKTNFQALGAAIIKGRPYRNINELVTRHILNGSDYDMIKGGIYAGKDNQPNPFTVFKPGVGPRAPAR